MANRNGGCSWTLLHSQRYKNFHSWSLWWQHDYRSRGRSRERRTGRTLFWFCLWGTMTGRSIKRHRLLSAEMKPLPRYIFSIMDGLQGGSQQSPWIRLLVSTIWCRLLSPCTSQLGINTNPEKKTQEATKENSEMQKKEGKLVRDPRAAWSYNPWPNKRLAEPRPPT